MGIKRIIITPAVVIIAAVALAGCESGNIFVRTAGYSLERSPEGGCKINVQSERDISTAMLSVNGETCSVEASADMQARATLQALQMGTLAVQALTGGVVSTRSLVPAPGQDLSDPPAQQ